MLKKEIVDFFEDVSISKIVNVLIEYSDSKTHYSDYIKENINISSGYLLINEFEIEYWVERPINLESDSDLLLDLIYRIPYNKDKYKNSIGIKTILNKLIEKVDNLKNNLKYDK